MKPVVISMGKPNGHVHLYRGPIANSCQYNNQIRFLPRVILVDVCPILSHVMSKSNFIIVHVTRELMRY